MPEIEYLKISLKCKPELFSYSEIKNDKIADNFGINAEEKKGLDSVIKDNLLGAVSRNMQLLQRGPCLRCQQGLRRFRLQVQMSPMLNP